MTDKAPTSMEELNDLVMRNMRIEGGGAETRTIFPCMFCGASDMFVYPVTAALDDYAGIAGPHTCDSCGRSIKIITTRTASGVSQEFVQTGGDPPPDWLEVKPRYLTTENQRNEL